MKNEYNISLIAQEGYALPSILFLVTILSLFAASIITLQYFMRQTSLISIAKVKAEYAAQNGIAKTISSIKTQNDLAQQSKDYQFEDKSEAHTTIKPWGVFLVVASKSSIHKIKKPVGT